MCYNQDKGIDEELAALPARAYLDATVTPAVLEGLKVLAAERY